MDGHHVDAGVDHTVAPLLEPAPQLRPVGLDLFDQHDRTASLDRLACALERLELHSLDVEFDEIEAAQLVLVQHQLPNRDGILIVDGLANELVLLALPQFKAAEAGGHEIVGIGDLKDTALRGHCGMHRVRIKTVVDCDIAGERVIDALLRLDCQHRAPSGHRTRPLDRVDADIGAAVDRHDAIAIMPSANSEQIDRKLHFVRVEAGLLQDLEADAVTLRRIDHVAVESIDDHRAVIG